MTACVRRFASLFGFLVFLALAPGLAASAPSQHSDLASLDPAPPWDTAPWDADPDWDFTSAADDTPDELYALWDSTIARSRATLAAAIADGGLDQPVRMGAGGQHANLRRLVCDLIEEYGRHTGHADLIREAVDGRVGEDPPARWRPRSPVASSG